MRALDDVFALILTLNRIKPHPSLPKRLGPLLSDLKKPLPSRDPKELAELVHALWISNRDAKAEQLMADAIAAIDQQKPEQAKELIEKLMRLCPAWSEAYYKRAIVALMLNNPSEAVSLLGETVRLEPRHFAAISLFGQICLDHNRLHEARAALQIALEMNPHLKGVADTISAIHRKLIAEDNRLNG